MADTTYCFTLNNDRMLTKLTKGNDTLIQDVSLDLGDATSIANAATGSTPASTLAAPLFPDNKQPVAPVFGQENQQPVANLKNKTPFDEIMVKNKEGENEVSMSKIMDDLRNKTGNKKLAADIKVEALEAIKENYESNENPYPNETELKEAIQRVREIFGNDGNPKLGGKHTRKHKVRRNHNKSHKMKSNKTRGKKTGKKSKASRKYRK